ncbi:MAG: sulfatase-like hydrolase/transferase, partial [Akkermansiaceae bacterium]|nr:sulfatase-like hydrolase/transferase [Akkermansiaceae bacterium]
MRLAPFLILASCLPLLSFATPAKNRPNILVVLCDDMGAHELGLYGHKDHRTPVLDELGRTGIW